MLESTNKISSLYLKPLLMAVTFCFSALVAQWSGRWFNIQVTLSSNPTRGRKFEFVRDPNHDRAKTTGGRGTSSRRYLIIDHLLSFRFSGLQKRRTKKHVGAIFFGHHITVSRNEESKIRCSFLLQRKWETKFEAVMFKIRLDKVHATFQTNEFAPSVSIQGSCFMTHPY